VQAIPGNGDGGSAAEAARTAAGRTTHGGGTTTSSFGCFEARGRAQAAPGCSSPPRAAPGGLLDGEKAATARIKAAAG
jgi:hypothetical protein